MAATYLSEAAMAIQTCIEECLKFHPHQLDLFPNDEILEKYENYVYNEIHIPEPVEILTLDFNTKRIILPNTLKVLDYSPFISTDFQFNFTPHLEYITLENTNIIGKELF